MKAFFAGPVAVGHTDNRRTIYDLIAEGDAGGGEQLYNLGYFGPLKSSSAIGRHYHANMWETYLILSGSGVMHLMDIDTREVQQIGVKDTLPYKITIPPRLGHTLVARSEMTLLIAATGPQSPKDTFPIKEMADL